MIFAKEYPETIVDFFSIVHLMHLWNSLRQSQIPQELSQANHFIS